MQRNEQSPEQIRAAEICDQFDAQVFTGDAFQGKEEAVILLEHAMRWQKAALNMLKSNARWKIKAPDLGASDWWRTPCF
nr:hypothetical protein [Providencia rettgeri]